MNRNLLLAVTIVTAISINAQPDKKTKVRLGNYFASYQNAAYTSNDRKKVESIEYNDAEKIVEIKTNEPFLGQPFTKELVDSIYTQVRNILPTPQNTWTIRITTNGYPIEQLVPVTQLHTEQRDARLWASDITPPTPWIKHTSLPYTVPYGLDGRHLCVWASHGRYYSQKKHQWEWQRPNLFGTCEDLFTQSFVIPFLMPMLENSGAIVFSPRERDWQSNEVIVDNDTDHHSHAYHETGRWKEAGIGFAHLKTYYLDKDNPFTDGTARMAHTEFGSPDATITWTPTIPQDGRYAVYVSYKTLPTSIPDARYTITHGGIETNVMVNQRMGGSTWVYLGTYHFDQGMSLRNCVRLTNQSQYKGHVSADAVRFGGGMGNIMRSDSTAITALNAEIQPDSLCPIPSYLPRYAEGSRYYMQWAGMPYSIYATKLSTNDYAEDINSRSHGVNHVARGSVYLPCDTLEGLNVPIELSIGIHSDAGKRDNMDIIGSLGIYTTQFYEGRLATGLSRLTSRDLADLMLSQMTSDLTYHLGKWTRRSLYDRNYSESREPQIPSIILETLSHQNYADMLVGHDPWCKFLIARAIYKAILRYTAITHRQEKIQVQPLPITDLAATADAGTRSITLTWSPQSDPLEPSAEPEGYIVYTRHPNTDWDNGVYVSTPHYTITTPDCSLYRFKVAAVNRGGRSMTSAEVCARTATTPGSPSVLIVNAFDRIAAPQAVDTDTLRGFDYTIDPGVAYIADATRYDLDGAVIAGNTFDYPSIHADDLLLTDRDHHPQRDISISTCTASSLPAQLSPYTMVDIIFGAQRDDQYSHRHYSLYTPRLIQSLTDYTGQGGRLLVSGAYIGEEAQSPRASAFTSQVLKFTYTGKVTTDSLSLRGMNTHPQLYNSPNKHCYYTSRINSISPTSQAFTTMVANDTHPIAVAYQGTDYHALSYGFPLETITDTSLRRAIINASYQFLCNTK